MFDSPEIKDEQLRARRLKFAEDMRSMGIPFPAEFVETEQNFQLVLDFINRQKVPGAD